MNFAKYDLNWQYPVRPVRPASFGTGYHVHPSKMTSAQLKEYTVKVEAFEKELAQHESDMKAYKAELARLEALFKKDLLEEHDLTTHPKADRIYEYIRSECNQDREQMEDMMSELTELFLA